MKISPIKNSIAAQLLMVVFFFYMIVTFSVTSAHMIAEFNNTKKSVQNELEIFGQAFAPSMARALWDVNLDQLQPTFLGMLKSPTVTGIIIRNEYGAVVGSAGIIPDGNNKDISEGDGHPDSDSIFSRSYSYTFPIVFKQNNRNNKIGVAVIYSNIGVVFNKVKLGFMFIIGNAIIKTIVLWVLVLWVSRHMLSRPLEKLASATKELTLDRLSNVQIDLGIKSRNELKVLEESFNAMIQKLNDSQNELAYKQQQFEGVIYNTPAVVFIKDVEGRYLLVNPKYESLFHLKLDDITGKTDYDIFPKDMADVFRKNDLQVINTGKPLEIEESVPHDDGVHIYHSIKFPLLDMNNQIYAVCGIASNITQLKISEKLLRDYSKSLEEEVGKQTLVLKKEIEERKKAKEAADMANRAKSEFLANVSHELRTPLNAILGFSQLMTRGPVLSSEQLSNLKIIERSGNHLLSLINDVLDFSKIEAGNTVLNQVNFDLYSFLSGLEDMFRLRAKEKGLYLDFVLGDDVPQYIRTDQRKLRQVLINLLGNAVKFTEKGGITLSIRNRPSSKKLQPHECLLLFEVVDTGIGISREEKEKVFDAFFQVERNRSSQQGTGLGLPISRKFTELMGGVLEVESEVGKGAHFTLEIPVEIADATGIDTALLQPKRRVTGLVSGQPDYRILVVEDNENNRNLLVKLLQVVGFDVQEAVNGQNAIEIWREWKPHLIWMDMLMPVMDGYKATTHIKTSAERNETVIIALTASAFEENRLKVIKQGCNDFVRKPFREAEIFEMLKKHLGVKFIYEEDTDTQAPAVHDVSNEKLKTMVAALPNDIHTRLVKAVAKCDAIMIEQLIKDIRIQNDVLADTLSALSEKFAYNVILNLLERREK